MSGGAIEVFLEPKLPAEVLYRDKMGFSVPLSRWISGPLKPRVVEAIRSDRLRALGALDERSLVGALDAHCSGRRDHGEALWALLVFDNFLASLE